LEKIKIFFRKVDWYFYKNILKRSIIKRRLIDFEMFLDLSNPGISQTLALNKVREADKVLLIKEYLKPHMTVLDCGSNIGFYPLLEAQILKEKGQIFSFEPDSRNYKVLEMNTNLCSYGKNIKLFNMAVSDKTGKARMILSTQSNLNRVFNTEEFYKFNGDLFDKSIEVKTISIDMLCSMNNIQIDFIRMDVEGHEIEIFRGMKNTVKEAKSGLLVLVELHPDYYSDRRDFSAELSYFFNYGFVTKVLVSAGEVQPSLFKELGYSPVRQVESDGFLRGWYENVSPEDAIRLTCFKPKLTRYLLLQKK